MRLLLALLTAALLATPLVLGGSGTPTWRDCNHDGVLGWGFAAGFALHPYPSPLLVDASLCPVGSPWNTGTLVIES